MAMTWKWSCWQATWGLRAAPWSLDTPPSWTKRWRGNLVPAEPPAPIQCGFWVVHLWVSICVCGGINSTKIKTIDNWESKKNEIVSWLSAYLSHQILLSSTCQQPRGNSNLDLSPTLDQPFASHMDSTKKLRMYRSHAMGIHAPAVFLLQEAHTAAPFKHAIISRQSHHPL